LILLFICFIEGNNHYDNENKQINENIYSHNQVNEISYHHHHHERNENGFQNINENFDSNDVDIIKHYCIVNYSVKDNNNYIECWGNNYFGELGQGDTTFRPFSKKNPVNLGTFDSNDVISMKNNNLLSVLLVSNGHSFSCALLNESKNIKCWGLNRFGQLGLNDNNNRGDDIGEMGITFHMYH